MGKKLYVGNLPFSCADAQLMEIFSRCGTVVTAQVILDRKSGRSKGFGFVEMAEDDHAAVAIAEYNGAEYEGRAMTVSEAKPMVPRDKSADGSHAAIEPANESESPSAATSDIQKENTTEA